MPIARLLTFPLSINGWFVSEVSAALQNQCRLPYVLDTAGKAQLDNCEESCKLWWTVHVLVH